MAFASPMTDEVFARRGPSIGEDWSPGYYSPASPARTPAQGYDASAAMRGPQLTAGADGPLSGAVRAAGVPLMVPQRPRPGGITTAAAVAAGAPPMPLYTPPVPVDSASVSSASSGPEAAAPTTAAPHPSYGSGSAAGSGPSSRAASSLSSSVSYHPPSALHRGTPGRVAPAVASDLPAWTQGPGGSSCNPVRGQGRPPSPGYGGARDARPGIEVEAAALAGASADAMYSPLKNPPPGRPQVSFAPEPSVHVAWVGSTERAGTAPRDVYTFTPNQMGYVSGGSNSTGSGRVVAGGGSATSSSMQSQGSRASGSSASDAGASHETPEGSDIEHITLMLERLGEKVAQRGCPNELVRPVGMMNLDPDAWDDARSSGSAEEEGKKGVRTICNGFKQMTRDEQMRTVETGRLAGRPAVNGATTAMYIRRLGRAPQKPYTHASGADVEDDGFGDDNRDASPIPRIDVTRGGWSYKDGVAPKKRSWLHYPSWPHYADETGRRAELAMVWQ